MKRLVVLLVALVAVLAGCKVDTSVTINMHDDGSGVVNVRATLDAQAFQRRVADAGFILAAPRNDRFLVQVNETWARATPQDIVARLS